MTIHEEKLFKIGLHFKGILRTKFLSLLQIFYTKNITHNVLEQQTNAVLCKYTLGSRSSKISFQSKRPDFIKGSALNISH